MAWQSGGGGGALPPGVTPDGNTPGGIIVAGGVKAGHVNIVADDLAHALAITTASGMVNGAIDVQTNDLLGLFHMDDHGSIEIDNRDNATVAFIINLLDNYTGNVVQISDLARSVDPLTLGATGKLVPAGGAGLYGHSVPDTQAVLATGAGHTADDVIILLQSYGLCKQS